jgi:hypothetical protein
MFITEPIVSFTSAERITSRRRLQSGQGARSLAPWPLPCVQSSSALHPIAHLVSLGTSLFGIGWHSTAHMSQLIDLLNCSFTDTQQVIVLATQRVHERIGVFRLEARPCIGPLSHEARPLIRRNRVSMLSSWRR